MQPAPAVDPWSPLPGTGHAGPGAVKDPRQVLERIDVERGSVIQAEVVVGLLCVIPTSATTAEQHPDHAVYLAEPVREPAQLLVLDHPHILYLDLQVSPHGPAARSAGQVLDKLT